MNENTVIDPGHDDKRAMLRLFGWLCTVMGAILLIGGIVQFVSYKPQTPEMSMPGFGQFPSSTSVRIETNDPEARKLIQSNPDLRRQIEKEMGGKVDFGSENTSTKTESSDSGPGSGMAMFITGAVLLMGGLSMLNYGYMGAVARYGAAELAPVATDTVSFATEELKDEITTVSRSIGEGLAAGSSHKRVNDVECPACGADNKPEAAFCKSCGVALIKTCSSCGEQNDPDARFCNKCGADLAQ